jgi:hypothetical protein
MDTFCDYVLVAEDWQGDIMNLATADFNGDGIEELYVLNIPPDGITGSYYIDSSGELIFEQHYFEEMDYLQIADINGDDYDDIVSWNTDEDLINVYYGGPEYDYEIDISLSVPHIVQYINHYNFYCNIGDINGDGEDELLINDGEVEVPGGHQLSNSATIYGHPGGNALDERTIDKGQWMMKNYPNPFNPETTIYFSTTESTEDTEIIIYNIKGELIREFRIKDEELRTNSVVWDGTDNYRKQVASGIYLYNLMAGGKTLLSQRMLLLK